MLHVSQRRPIASVSMPQAHVCGEVPHFAINFAPCRRAAGFVCSCFLGRRWLAPARRRPSRQPLQPSLWRPQPRNRLLRRRSRLFHRPLLPHRHRHHRRRLHRRRLHRRLPPHPHRPHRLRPGSGSVLPRDDATACRDLARPLVFGNARSTPVRLPRQSRHIGTGLSFAAGTPAHCGFERTLAGGDFG